ncbi:MAG TPA: transglycosylase SLT domain-containing protein [Gemmatimonadota bacterium]|nr:transglycosylase SLT domain-containing protein [Gemmatimonadota bacterium]
MKTVQLRYVLVSALVVSALLLPPALAGGSKGDKTRFEMRVGGDDLGMGSVAGDSTIAGFAARYGISRSLARVIYETAVAYGVEPAIVFGLIATESTFNPRAMGRAGALGLMQIKPSTARIYDRRITREQLLSPEINLRLGLRHLLREFEHFGRDWTLGLLAYNMGRTRLSRALDRGRVPRTAYADKVLAHCEDPCS